MSEPKRRSDVPRTDSRRCLIVEIDDEGADTTIRPMAPELVAQLVAKGLIPPRPPSPPPPPATGPTEGQ